LKTTQSAFRDFVQDEYRTLPDSNDRIFSTVVTASWEYSTAIDVNFDSVWQIVKDCILDKFAGPPDSGLFSPSVQNTLYLAEKQILEKVKQVRISVMVNFFQMQRIFRIMHRMIHVNYGSRKNYFGIIIIFE